MGIKMNGILKEKDAVLVEQESGEDQSSLKPLEKKPKEAEKSVAKPKKIERRRDSVKVSKSQKLEKAQKLDIQAKDKPENLQPMIEEEQKSGVNDIKNLSQES